MSNLVVASTRKPLRLLAEIGKGGEGTVWTLADASDRVAKIYLTPPSHAKVEKLRLMAAMTGGDLSKVAAWPLDLVLNKRAEVTGFIMPRVAAHSDAHELYSPKSRAGAFPEADFRFLVHVASNVARAFRAVHRTGYIIGDVNHGHLLVGRDGRVVLIDCDSFQTPTPTGVLTCDVGVALFTPPELHGRSFKGLVRTPDHDAFGMAVLIFHLLCMGRHPYAGVWSGRGEMSIEKAIAERRFAYGSHRKAMMMDRPPGTIDLADLGPRISGLFDATFAPTPGRPRPTPAAWVSALDSLKAALKPCTASGAHFYPSHMAACPWCVIEGQTGARLFGQRIRSEVGQVINIAALWSQIERVAPPPPDPALPSARLWKPPSGMDVPSPLVKQVRIAASLAAVCIGLVACGSDGGVGPMGGMIGAGVAFAIWPRVSAARRQALAAAVNTAQANWNQLEGRWRAQATVAAFMTLKRQLSEAHTEFKGLPARRVKLLAELRAKREAHQKDQYLDRFRIDRAQIAGVGPGRAATLASFGIETAADVERYKILNVRGFGPSLCDALVGWRRQHESRFRFNPAAPVDPRETRRVEDMIESRRKQLVGRLQAGPRELLTCQANILAARARLEPVLKSAWDDLQLALARQRAA